MHRRRGARLTIAGVVLAALALAVVGGVALAKKKTVRVSAPNMTGQTEVPSGDADGTGNGDFKLKKKQKKVCFDVDFQNIQAPFVAHIHKGRAGEAGPIKVLLFDTPGGATSPQTGCVEAGKSLIKRIGKKPRKYYCNVHTEDFPDGAIREQLQEGPLSGGGGYTPPPDGGGTPPPYGY